LRDPSKTWDDTSQGAERSFHREYCHPVLAGSICSGVLPFEK
jgi:hypothetical protein